jgi:CPA2 family monovalent cation:H+ antiporter-2
LEQLGVGVAIMGERELAFGLMEYALRSLGVSQYKTQVIVQSLRTSGEGGAFERHAELEPRRSAPELRHHRETEESIEG